MGLAVADDPGEAPLGQRPEARLRSIQYLRAVAALLVVFHHARNPKPGLYDPLTPILWGQAGVDLFFVISGYVLYRSAISERAFEFLKRRFWRVVPLYWLATIATAALDIAHSPTKLTAPFAGHILKSLLFIPHMSLEVPGQAWPYILQGWTLNYEIFFYLLVTLGIASRRPIVVPVTLIALCVATGLIVRSPNLLWRTYSDPLMLEFLLGVALARCDQNVRAPFVILLLPLGCLLIALSGFFDGPRIVLWGIPALLIIAGALALERNGFLPHFGWLGRLGDASYAIYLFQFWTFTLVNKLAAHSPRSWSVQIGERIGLSLLLAAMFGLAIHHFVERPLVARRGRLPIWKS